MRVIVVGLGIQGRKRLAVAGPEAVAIVDPVAPGAQFKRVEDVPLEAYDAALVCTPDQAKLPILEYLLKHRKHLLVEKPVIAPTSEPLRKLKALAEYADEHGELFDRIIAIGVEKDDVLYGLDLKNSKIRRAVYESLADSDSIKKLFADHGEKYTTIPEGLVKSKAS